MVFAEPGRWRVTDGHQYSLHLEDAAPRAFGNTLAAQFTVKF